MLRISKRAGYVGLMSASLLTIGQARALDIVLDYTHDTYIQTNANAMAAIEAAAADIEAVIGSVLPERFDANSVTVGKATASIDWAINYTNPANGSSISIDPVNLPADEYRVFVGVRPITQPGNGSKTLGRGGSAGVSLSNGFGIEPLFQNEIPQAIADLGTAVAQLETEANANAGRGGVGPTFGSFNLDFSGSIGGTNFSYDADVSYGVGVGNLWFDVDTDDNGSFDNNATLDDYWHWNHTTPASGKNDFYSVALHELLHTLGFGSSDSWDDLIDPSDPDEWLGASLIALRGTGENAIDIASGAHLAEGLEGVVYGTSTTQEAVMDPSNTVGDRKLLTDFDVAVLEDIGWDIVAVSGGLAGDYNGDGFVSQADLDLVLLNWGNGSIPPEWTNPDAWDGVQVSQNELDGVLLNWGNGTPPVVAIPEPTTAMAFVGLAGAAGWRRRRVSGR